MTKNILSKCYIKPTFINSATFKDNYADITMLSYKKNWALSSDLDLTN